MIIRTITLLCLLNLAGLYCQNVFHQSFYIETVRQDEVKQFRHLTAFEFPQEPLKPILEEPDKERIFKVCKKTLGNAFQEAQAHLVFQRCVKKGSGKDICECMYVDLKKQDALRDVKGLLNDKFKSSIEEAASSECKAHLRRDRERVEREFEETQRKLEDVKKRLQGDS